MSMPIAPTAAVPLSLLAPPNGIPARRPTRTRAQRLPFEDLSWENFERLCLRLVATDARVERCARYGASGEAQQGIDVFARKRDGAYSCLQAKRQKAFGPAKVRDAVDLFLGGTWAGRSNEFLLAVQADMGTTAVQEEIERQAIRLLSAGTTFAVLDGEALTVALRAHPTLVDDFFGRAWVEALLGPDEARRLGTRLDGDEMARVRAQVARAYAAQFHFVDPGSFGSVVDEEVRPALTLRERFARPDLLVAEASPAVLRTDTSTIGDGAAGSEGPAGETIITDTTRARPGLDLRRTRRIDAGSWFEGGERFVVLGDAGSGKSTLLRVIALDLLDEGGAFPELAARWGDRLPIYLPFPRWAAEVGRAGAPVGVKEVVRRSLQQVLTADLVNLLDRAIDDGRVLLLVDGLDEWSSEQAARSTLSTLVQTVETHDIPLIVSGRPRGLDRVGALPGSWRRASIAPLSEEQQAEIAARWFGRYSTTESGQPGETAPDPRASRFMAELAREPGLASLASTPLLLVGLVTLALRGRILPRTRNDAYDQLTRILLEVHPANRATASGDTEPRFRHARDPEQRRAALAKLAHSLRMDGGASVPLATARRTIAEFLAAAEGFSMRPDEAQAVAEEMTAVNAETQGLLVEKSAGEVGFVHLSFEEYLCAEHVGGWPFDGIKAFVRDRSGQSRWRNVLFHLLTAMRRRDEFDRLVAVAEGPSDDEIVRLSRASLLGEVGFGSVARAPATARRLALSAMDRVEAGAWPADRSDALASVLRGVAEPALAADVEARLRRWLPDRASYRASAIERLGRWKPSAEVTETLWRALYDEDRGVQRAAAVAFGEAHRGDHAAKDRLLHGLATGNDLAAAVAMVEALAHGWAGEEGAAQAFEAASRSSSAELRLVGRLGLASRGETSTEAKREAFEAQSFWSDLSYPHRELAGSMLLRFWPNDDDLMPGALRRAGRSFDSFWEPGLATRYLLEGPTGRVKVRDWILAELGQGHPFVMARDDRTWWQVGRFALADDRIRAAANAHWLVPENRLINLHHLKGYVAQVADRELAEMLVGVVAGTRRMDRHWAVLAMLTGWGRDHPDVRPTLDALVNGPDEDLADVVALVPQLIPDRGVARNRLLRLANVAHVRRDLLASGFQECGCDGSDDEAVIAIMTPGEGAEGIYDPTSRLFESFAAHSSVRELALERLRRHEPPLSALAAGFGDDAEIAPLILEALSPLASDLRAQIVEAATTGGSGSALRRTLARWEEESDPELRARMALAHFVSHNPAGDPARERAALLTAATAVGPDFETRRATALVGLVATGDLQELAVLRDQRGPVAVETGRLMHPIPTVERLVCERFAEFREAFGDGLEERFRSFGSDSRLPEILASSPNASAAAQERFVDYAERDAIPRTPAALRGLATVQPGGELLLRRCLQAIDAPDSRNDRASDNAEIALLLRNEFPDDASIRREIETRFEARPFVALAAALAVYHPGSDMLGDIDLTRHDREFGYWIVAAHLAAHRSDTVSFVDTVRSMVLRRMHSQFDGQGIVNEAVERRVRADVDAVGLLEATIREDVDPSLAASASRYLGSAGALSDNARHQCTDLLRALGTGCSVPVACFDAVADRWRTARATIFDALSAGLETP
jgi:energy-coupling factor transporter ATP-binding protein EcfA2